MDVNDNAFILNERGALETIASRLAPTGMAAVERKKPRACMASAGLFRV